MLNAFNVCKKRRSKRKSTVLDTLATDNAKKQMNKSTSSREANKENEDANREYAEQRPARRRKLEDTETEQDFKAPGPSRIARKCPICRQKINEELKIYQGAPNDAVKESVALIHPKLCLFTGEENRINEEDEFPQQKLTYFSVFDRNGHLCPFDTGLVDDNVRLYFSGYIKPIYEEDPTPDGGIPAKMMGPINEWSISGFDGGELALVFIKSQYAEYILMEPTPEYAHFMTTMKEKSYISKHVIEFLLDKIDPTYEDLVNKLETTVPADGLQQFTEETLIKHAQFICDQVLSLDSSAEDDKDLLITTRCMRALVNLAGVTVGRKNALRQIKANRMQRKKRPVWTKATTTRLVNDMFEHFFSEQLTEHDDKGIKQKRKTKCGVCGHCQAPDCGECVACRGMIKFGGTGKIKQSCIKRRCPNMAIQYASEFDAEDDNEPETTAKDMTMFLQDETSNRKIFKELIKDIKWVGEQISNRDKSEKKYYACVNVNDETIEVGDYVLVEPQNTSDPSHIAKVVYMWQGKIGKKMFHAQWLHRGNETILGETSHTGEVFLSDECNDVPLNSVRSKCTVIYKKTPEDWAELGNAVLNPEDENKYEDGKTFFYQKRYLFKTARFEDPLPELECTSIDAAHRFCAICDRLRELKEFNKPKVYERIEEKSNKKVTYSLLQYKGEYYTVGSAVFLQPDAFTFKYKLTYTQPQLPKKHKIDQTKYTEYYRKSTVNKKGLNSDTPDPFCIGCVCEIFATTTRENPQADEIYITVNKLYRPQNTHKECANTEGADLNKLYWSDEVCKVKFIDIIEKCYVVYIENITENIDEWTDAGPYRFYFSEAYDIKTKTFGEPPSHARCLGRSGTYKGSKGTVKSKGKKSHTTMRKEFITKPVDYKTISRKLRTLDVFSGCGGLTEGLHQSGISETRWAIEHIEEAANAFRKNYPDATVFVEDCNALLNSVMTGKTKDEYGQTLPQKGDVEILCGGPPCQGFSGMNRFNQREYSMFKNSLVVTFLSYCDYYRPKFLIMENVKNFISFKNNVVLKLTLSCLIRMGYQCTFDYLQAGSYGVPQTRRRMILIAAAPGQTLPNYPAPTHSFIKSLCSSLCIGNKWYNTTRKWITSGPYRTITVKDALSDLPEIERGCQRLTMPYINEPMSHYQRKVREKMHSSMLRDHVCKEMSPLVVARITHIPLEPGADWRDLPNIALKLPNGVIIKKLQYTHHDRRVGRSPTGELRGVCSCAEGKACDSTDRQFDTLIPWCLPHTSARHNNWAGLYGRLQWDGHFSTSVTSPEPMGKQGRVLHPEEHRVVSVREYARSQGFPDSHYFLGNRIDMYRQVGNAVPPPLAAAVGHEIRKCIGDTSIISKIETEGTESCSTRRKSTEEDRSESIKNLEKVDTSQRSVEKVQSELIEDPGKPGTSQKDLN